VLLTYSGQAGIFGVAGLNWPGYMSTMPSDSNVSVSLVHACGAIWLHCALLNKVWMQAV